MRQQPAVDGPRPGGDAWFGYSGLFRDFTRRPEVQLLRILEINPAGNLTRFLEPLPGHVLTTFQAVDMRHLSHADDTFDLVIHSDTLEHVADPVQGLVECLRVLKPGGACYFTVPLLPDRLTRSRGGLPPSYHGDPSNPADCRVVTEYGADAWAQVMQAGFEECRIVCLEYPTSQALIGVKPNRSALGTGTQTGGSVRGCRTARTVQDRVLGRKWFYRFQVPGRGGDGFVLPPPVASIHETREQMMFSVLDPLVGSGWEQATAMDLGCHEGYFAHRLAAKGCAHVVRGVDATGESIENANLLRSAFGRTNVEFQVGEVQALEPTRLGTFDIVLLFGLLYHLEDPVAALRLARRLTRTFASWKRNWPRTWAASSTGAHRAR